MKIIDEFGKGLKEFSENIAIIVNSVLLSVVYLIGIGLTSIFAKIFRKHFLDLKPDNCNSYWTDLNIGKKKLNECYRQF